ncbi:hypothetical protein Dsin_017274 [Dipteronia sinensis]|uniref:Transposase MuDR plant domain-containing protein n=1 Tax=Dipteronia sinensis TaxID=43782 RepID=A0AAE0AFE5_9ROSI|nr:hypothetical protein Dsin_017274 [Dipteronia sinensis]
MEATSRWETKSISIVPGTTCHTFKRNDNDVQFMLGEDREIPQVCVSLIERRCGGAMCDDIPLHGNPQHYSFVSVSNQMFTQRSGTYNDGNPQGIHAIRENFEWKVKRSNKSVLYLVCMIDNCKWKLRAVRRDEGTYFQVRSFDSEHSCPLEKVYQHHRQASAVIIGEVIAPRLQQHDGRLIRPKDISTDMKIMFGIQVMYSKAYQAVNYALANTYRSHEETFQLLPSFGYVLEQNILA